MIMLSNKIEKSKLYIACVTNFNKEGETANAVVYIPLVMETIPTRTQKMLELAWTKFILKDPTTDCLHRRFDESSVTMIGYNDSEIYNIACATVCCGVSFKKILAVKYDDEKCNFKLPENMQAVNCTPCVLVLEEQGLITNQPQSLSKRDIAKIILQLSETYPTLSDFLGVYDPKKPSSQKNKK